MAKFICLPIFIIITITACNYKGGDYTSEDNNADYLTEIEEWRADRLSGLKRPRSWTSLVGLTWLKEGENTFGSDSSSDVQISNSPAEHIGIWTVRNDSVHFKVNQGIEIKLSDQTVFTEGPVQTDVHDNPHFFQLGALYWTIIKRSELHGVRIWDTAHHLRSDITQIPHYSTDPDWRLQATVVPADQGATVMMDNAVGQSMEYPVAGHVTASKSGQDINLIALDGGTDNLFLIFSDLSTDIETYSGGRYIYIPRGDSLGKTVIDFNKAYNPPCVFTAFATCLLPPKSNFIDLEVHAGEKNYGEH